MKRPLFRPPSATGDIDDLAVFLDARYIAKGYLMKLSTKKKWQRRMYQLKGPWLMYWETDHATRKDMTITRSQYTVTMPDAAIDLRRISSCRVESAADSNTGVLLLTSASGRVIQMKATSDSCEEQGVLSRWETAILAQMDRYKAAAGAAESGDGAQTAEVVLKDGHADAGSEEDAAAASAAGAAAGETATERQSEFVALQQSPILVLGGTGSVGKATLRSLARARAGDATSSPILAAVRTPDPSLPKNVEIAALADADLEDEEEWATLVASCSEPSQRPCPLPAMPAWVREATARAEQQMLQEFLGKLTPPLSREETHALTPRAARRHSSIWIKRQEATAALNST